MQLKHSSKAIYQVDNIEHTYSYGLAVGATVLIKVEICMLQNQLLIRGHRFFDPLGPFSTIYNVAQDRSENAPVSFVANDRKHE